MVWWQFQQVRHILKVLARVVQLRSAAMAFLVASPKRTGPIGWPCTFINGELASCSRPTFTMIIPPATTAIEFSGHVLHGGRRSRDRSHAPSQLHGGRQPSCKHTKDSIKQPDRDLCKIVQS
ncbi:hypothetical protein HBI56_086110 [Parastagonospora nodorum]|nr:hypothetical protein HBH56_113440 [Parastagonospora nodorum]KAH3921530.1 hypothetical protein HBH54_238980 [Parastagonospora nodorum]KAH3951060.1 hypothetical protein HBH53_069120 [Parastagonospora nodorum]KAH3963009.1 hypothetical protein HBH51_169790 [Parastagonospora nodorum]KAH3979350.1 hypothetical protein HBH52_097080 [Parastagonospora nodorum]